VTGVEELNCGWIHQHEALQDTPSKFCPALPPAAEPELK